MIIQKARLNTETLLKDCSITKENKKLIVYLQDYKKNLNEKINNCENLILNGSCGAGKSFIINAFINEIHSIKVEKETKDYSPMYGIIKKVITTNLICFQVNCYELISQLRERNYNKQKLDCDYFNCDLLVIDEVGVQFATDAERQILYELIDYRYNFYKPTFIISNLQVNHNNDNKQSIEYVLGQRIFSRLKLNNCKIITINGNMR